MIPEPIRHEVERALGTHGMQVGMKVTLPRATLQWLWERVTGDVCLHDETTRLGTSWIKCTQCGHLWWDGTK